MDFSDLAVSAQETKAAKQWLALFNMRYPLAGSTIRRSVLNRLLTFQGRNPRFVYILLAWLLEYHFDASFRATVGRLLQQVTDQAGINLLWAIWSSSRYASLSAILTGGHRAATRPGPVRVISLLHLQQLEPLQNIEGELTLPLISYCTDKDPLIATRARYAITQLRNPEAISTLCTAWASQRSPLLENAILQAGYQPDQPVKTRLLVALKFNHLEKVTFGKPAVVAPLLDACQDADVDVNARARFCLVNLHDVDTISHLCQQWFETRDPTLAAAIQMAQYVASAPPPARVLSMLQAGRADLAAAIQPDEVQFLLAACLDGDKDLAARAQEAAHHLTNPAAQEMVCALFIERDSPEIAKLAREAGYLPRDPEQRALFFFLTAQWQAYETLDFDQRYLNAVYETATPELRQRIIRKVRQSGRKDYLTILAGADYRSRAAKITPLEADLLVRLLTTHRDWIKLWGLAKELSLPHAVEILRILAQNGWQPETENEQGTFKALLALAQNPLVLEPAELTKILPNAVPCAILKTSGRVNDIAFSPHRPLLAIGTGSRRVALWDYQNARMEKIYTDFNHSISQVSFTRSGLLLCAERTTAAIPCRIYHLEPDRISIVGQHAGSVTALEPFGDDLVLSTGRDQQVTLWDAANSRRQHSAGFGFWPRAASISSDETQAILLHKGYDLITLPDLGARPVPRYTLKRGQHIEDSITRTAAILPGTGDILTGQNNGQIVHYRPSLARPAAREVYRSDSPIEHVQVIPGHDLAVTACANGRVIFFRLPEVKMAGNVVNPLAGRLTSLRVSADGAFMASGVNESSLALWDLRVMDIPALFQQPLACARPEQITTVNALAQYPQIPAPVHHALLILQHLLHLRFQYDIQVSDLPDMRYGEFDVMID